MDHRGSLLWVSPLALRRRWGRFRNRRTATLAALLMAMAIAAHHSAIGMSDGMHHGMGMNVVAEICLGVFTAVGAAVASVAVGLVRLGRWRPPSPLLASGLSAAVAAPLPRARAGPPLLSLICVCRR